MNIRRNDNVFIITGKDHGKTGLVNKVLPKKDKILVTGINIAKHHLKPSKKNPHGGIMDIPAPITASNAMIVCPHCGKPVKAAYKITDKNKERICRKCQGSLDTKDADVKS